MVTATPSWAQATMTTARESLPRLQQEVDDGRVRRDERRARMAATERASAALDPEKSEGRAEFRPWGGRDKRQERG